MLRITSEKSIVFKKYIKTFNKKSFLMDYNLIFENTLFIFEWISETNLHTPIL